MRILAALAMLVLVTGATPVRVQTEGSGQVPVLLYHNLTTSETTDDAATLPVHEFAAQMDWLSRNRFSPITMAQLRAWLLEGEPLPAKPVLITFDDGYQSNYDLAFPIMERHGLRFTVFVVTSSIGKTVGKYPHLAAETMQEMERSGLVEFHAHSHDGHRVVGSAPALVQWSASEIALDVTASEAAFAAAGLPAPTAYAYPFGAFDDEVTATLADFDLGFTVEPGYAKLGDTPLRLARQIIYPGTPLCRFGEIVAGRAPGSACPR